MTRSPKRVRGHPNEKQIAVWIRDELKDSLMAAAFTERRSQKEIIEAALEGYFARPAPSASPP